MQQGKVEIIGLGSLAQLAGLALGKLASLLFFVLLLRFFSPSELGKYFVFIAVLGFLSLLSGQWSGDVLLVFIPKKKGKGDGIAARWLILTLSLSLLVALVVVIFPFLSWLGLGEFKAVLAVILLFSGLVSWISTFLGAKKEFFVPAFANLAGMWFRLLALAVLLFLGLRSISAVFFALLVYYLTYVALTLWKVVLSFSFPRLEEVFSWSELVEELSFAAQSFLSRIVGLVVGWTDVLILKFFGGFAIAGAYGGIRSIIYSVVMFPAFPISNVLLPVLAGENEALQRDAWGYSFRWLFRGSALTTFALILLSPLLFTFLFPHLADYVFLVPIFIATALIRASLLFVRFEFRGKKIIQPVFFMSAVEGALNALLDLIFVPFFGAAGAALASFLATLTGELGLLRSSGRDFGFLARDLLKPSVGFFLLFYIGVTYSLWHKALLWAFVIALISFVFFITALILEMEKRDWEYLFRLTKALLLGTHGAGLLRRILKEEQS